jgi:hypothetical protein
MDPSWCPRRTEAARMRRETAELSLITCGNDIFVTNRTGTAIWELLDGATPLDAIARALSERYAVDAVTAASNSHRFIGDLRARGMVE